MKTETKRKDCLRLQLLKTHHSVHSNKQRLVRFKNVVSLLPHILKCSEIKWITLTRVWKVTCMVPSEFQQLSIENFLIFSFIPSHTSAIDFCSHGSCLSIIHFWLTVASAFFKSILHCHMQSKNQKLYLNLKMTPNCDSTAARQKN